MTLWFSDILDPASRTECAKGQDQIRAQSVKSKYLIVLCGAYTILHHPYNRTTGIVHQVN